MDDLSKAYDGISHDLAIAKNTVAKIRRFCRRLISRGSLFDNGKYYKYTKQFNNTVPLEIIFT